MNARDIIRDWTFDDSEGTAIRTSAPSTLEYKQELYNPQWLLEQYNNPPMRERAKKVVQFARSKGIQKSLDIGCATGYHVEQLARAGIDAYGLDMLKECITFAVDHSEHGKFILGDMKSLGGERFDLITLTYILEHIEQPVPFLMEALNHLRPGGYVYIGIPNLSAYRPESPFYCYPWEMFHPDHVANYDSRGIASMLRLCGFTDIETHTNTYLGESFSVWSHSFYQWLNKDNEQGATGLPHPVYNSTLSIFKKPPLNICLKALDRLQDAAGMGWELVATGRRGKA